MKHEIRYLGLVITAEERRGSGEAIKDKGIAYRYVPIYYTGR